MNMKKTVSRYFYKYLIYSMLLSLLPMLFVSIVSYNQLIGIVQKNASGSAINSLNQIRLREEQLINLVEKSAMQFVMLPQVDTVLKQDISASDYQLVNELRNMILQISYSEFRVDETYLINPSNDWVLSEKNLFRFSDWEKRSYVSRYFTNSSINYNWSLDRIPNDTEEEYFLTKIFKIPMNSNGENAYLYIKLSAHKFSKYILSGADENILIADCNNKVIASINQEQIGSDITKSVYFNKMKDTELDRSFITNKEKGKENITYIKNSKNGMTFLSFTSNAHLHKEIFLTLIWVILFCIVTIVAVIFLSIRTSKALYKPIHNLFVNTLRTDENIIINKSTDEFSLISDRIKDLEYSKDRVIDDLKVRTDELRDYSIKNLILGNVKDSAIDDTIKNLLYTSNWKRYCALGIQIISYKNSWFNEGELELVNYSINNIVNELLSAEEYFKSVILNGTLIIILGDENYSDNDFFADTLVKAKTLRSVICEILKIEILVGISRTYIDFRDLPRAYDELVKIFTYNILNTKSVEVYYEDLESENADNVKMPFQTKDNLIHSIKIAEEIAAVEFLKEFIFETFSNKSNSFHQLSVSTLFFELLSIVKDSELEIYKTLSSEAQIEKMMSCKRPQEFEEFFLNSLVLPIMNYVREGKKKQSKFIAENMIEQIEKNYDKDISLVSCADVLYYNANYISKIFKDETGYTFSEYLSNYRLEISKHLLKETDMKILDIAIKLCYSNTENFIRYFKKLEGITPGQYRKNNSKRT